MLTRRRTTKTRAKPQTIQTYTVTLIGVDGSHTPIGEKGAPTFHCFHDWTIACDAIADAVGSMARLSTIHGVVVTTTQTRPDPFGGVSLLVVGLRKFDRDEVGEIYEGATDIPPGPSVVRGDGRRVRVSVPVNDDDLAPSDGQL
jgi:hypothetical protein